MKIRMGYVTNSSSTNFLILSKEELTVEFLYEKLGFKHGSPIEQEAIELCENILNGTQYGLRWHSINRIDYENIKKIFGEVAAKNFLKYQKKKYKCYIGHTSSDEGTLTSFFTTDCFEIQETGLYIYARDCVW